ncbi:hypothetical protein FCG96_33565, partial [Pseudomonas aeruginosa]
LHVVHQQHRAPRLQAPARQVSRHYTSLCDPRLNPWQALSAVMAWSGAEAIPSATFPLETVA